MSAAAVPYVVLALVVGGGILQKTSVRSIRRWLRANDPESAKLAWFEGWNVAAEIRLLRKYAGYTRAGASRTPMEMYWSGLGALGLGLVLTASWYLGVWR